MCHLLAEGLVETGHDVTLVAAGPDNTRANLIRTFPEAQGEHDDRLSEKELVHAARATSALREIEVDVVHDHTMAGALSAGGRRAPTVVTVHAALAGPDSQALLWESLGRLVPLVAVSDAHRAAAPLLNWAGRVYNGIPIERYPLRKHKDDFVLFLGRMSPHKGVSEAIDAAESAGRPIVVAGEPSTASEQAFFDAAVRPRLGPDVKWAGEVAGAEKAELLGRAACLLFPIRWEEPFGLVMVEAMACGTPVVGLRAGSVPEVVSDGTTGIICDHPAQLAAGIVASRRLSPRDCRKHVEERFSARRMVQEYERLYRALLGGS